MGSAANSGSKDVIKLLGRDLLDLSEKRFLELLFHCSFGGMDKASLAELEEQMDIQIPAPFIKLHRGKLKYWHVFSHVNVEHPIADTSEFGAVYHNELQVGVITIFNDSVAELWVSDPFAFENGVLPKQKIIDRIVKFLSDVCMSFCAKFINHVPEMCPRQLIYDIYRANTYDPSETDEEFEEHFQDGYSEG
jgi:hypothetical protein